MYRAVSLRTQFRYVVALSFSDEKVVSSVHHGTLSIEKNSLYDFKPKLSTTKRRRGLWFILRFSSYLPVKPVYSSHDITLHFMSPIILPAET